MKIILVLIAVSLEAAPPEPKPPAEIPAEIQIEVLAAHFELLTAQAAAAPYIDAANRAEEASRPADAKATQACNPPGTTVKYRFELVGRKVVCVVAPPSPAEMEIGRRPTRADMEVGVRPTPPVGAPVPVVPAPVDPKAK